MIKSFLVAENVVHEHGLDDLSVKHSAFQLGVSNNLVMQLWHDGQRMVGAQIWAQVSNTVIGKVNAGPIFN